MHAPFELTPAKCEFLFPHDWLLIGLIMNELGNNELALSFLFLIEGYNCVQFSTLHAVLVDLEWYSDV